LKYTHYSNLTSTFLMSRFGYLPTFTVHIAYHRNCHLPSLPSNRTIGKRVLYYLACTCYLLVSHLMKRGVRAPVNFLIWLSPRAPVYSVLAIFHPSTKARWNNKHSNCSWDTCEIRLFVVELQFYIVKIKGLFVGIDQLRTCDCNSCRCPLQ